MRIWNLIRDSRKPLALGQFQVAAVPVQGGLTARLRSYLEVQEFRIV